MNNNKLLKVSNNIKPDKKYYIYYSFNLTILSELQLILKLPVLIRTAAKLINHINKFSTKNIIFLITVI